MRPCPWRLLNNITKGVLSGWFEGVDFGGSVRLTHPTLGWGWLCDRVVFIYPHLASPNLGRGRLRLFYALNCSDFFIVSTAWSIESVTVKRSISLGEIYPSVIVFDFIHSSNPLQYSLPNKITGNAFMRCV